MPQLRQVMDAHVLMHLFILATVVSFGLLILIRSKTVGLHDGIDPIQYRYLVTALLAIGTIFVFCFTPAKKYYIRHDDEDFEDRSHEHGASDDADELCTLYLEGHDLFSSAAAFVVQHAHTLAVCVFGSACLFINILIFMSTCQCIPWMPALPPNTTSSDCEVLLSRDYKVAVAVSLAVRIVFIVVVMALLLQLAQYGACRRSHTRYRLCLVPVTAACFSMWLYSFMRESDIDPSLTDKDCGRAGGGESRIVTSSLGAACMNESTAIDNFIENSVTEIFYPISMEFCMTSIEILYHVIFIKVVSDQAPKSSSHYLLSKLRALCDTAAETQVVRLVDKTPCEQCHEETASGEVPDTGGDSENAPLLQPSSFCRHRRSYNYTDNSGYLNERSLPNYGNNTFQVDLKEPVTRETAPVHCSWLTKIWGYCISVNHCYVALVVGIVEAMFVIAYIEQIEVYNEQYFECCGYEQNESRCSTRNCTMYIRREYLNKNISMPLVIYRLFVSCLPSLIVSIHCYMVMKKFTVPRPHPEPFKLSLLLGIACCGVMTIYEFYLCVHKLHKSDSDLPKDIYWLNVVTPIQLSLYLPQYVFQTMVIYLGQRRRAAGWRRSALHGTLRRCLLFLAMYNLVQWADLSFLEKHYIEGRFSEPWQDKTRWLPLLMIPATIYFRFISVPLLLGIEASLQRDEVNVRRWQMFVHTAPGDGRLHYL